MAELENDAARLRSLSYLLREALRIAQEGNRPVICAQIRDCAERVALDLADVTEQIRVQTGIE